ncbi:Zinc finger Y-chromosomal protein 1 [Portunus trituberculatus]|uniref:Zinc finger Y-chromosomal protein 1 n=1 Tax=Portunus trituberculatus TaxID=210409 RepID=A0A5B7IIB6_PORTR|nr:Zinc finger Y-chromosomal protein 1 [Portunus trituberculatus]
MFQGHRVSPVFRRASPMVVRNPCQTVTGILTTPLRAAAPPTIAVTATNHEPCSTVTGSRKALEAPLATTPPHPHRSEGKPLRCLAGGGGGGVVVVAGQGGAVPMEECRLPLPAFLSRLGLPAAPHAAPLAPQALHALDAADLDLGGRRHQCGVCGRGFRLANDLRRHLRTHTGEKPYLCPHCPYRASQKQSVNRHVRTVHSDLFLAEEASLARTPASLANAAAVAAAAAAASAPRLAAYSQARTEKL